jgi:hypothetical protein
MSHWTNGSVTVQLAIGTTANKTELKARQKEVKTSSVVALPPEKPVIILKPIPPDIIPTSMLGYM